VSPSRRTRPIEVDVEDDEIRPVRSAPADSEPADSEPDDSEPDDSEPAAAGPADSQPNKPLYPRLLRLSHIQPNAWQRAALGEGAIGVGVLLAMADLASAWTIVALPVAVAGIVKAHDALQGLLDRGRPAPPAA
jgi:hypothetical protein